MGKLFNTMILGIAITLVLLLFNGGGQTPNSIFLLLLSPSDWTNSTFWSSLTVLFTVGGGLIIIGLGAIIKQDWVVRAGAVSALSTVFLAPFIDLWSFIHSQTNFIGNSYVCNNPAGISTSNICSYINAGGGSGGIGQVIALVFAGILILYAIWAVLEWIWRGDS